jgi:hypothetical protein
MGYYINPKTGSKEEWLAKNAKPISDSQAESFKFGLNSLPVCLVDNGGFTAAGIAYDARELRAFLNPDPRPKKWYSVESDKLKEWFEQ